jgi:hypothetical protein
MQKVIFFLAIMFIVAGCSNQSNNAASKYCYQHDYDQLGRLVLSIDNPGCNSDYPSCTEYVYSQNGRYVTKVEKSGCGNMDPTRITEYSYNEDGDLIHEEYPADETPNGYSNGRAIGYIYDGWGYLVKKIITIYSENGTFVNCMNYEYNLRGLLSKSIIDYDCTGQADEIATSDYDEAGNLILLKTTSMHGGFPTCKSFQWTHQNEAFVQLDSDCDKEEATCWFERYDNAGNIVERYDTDSCHRDQIRFCRFNTYDDHGNLVYVEFTSDCD